MLGKRFDPPKYTMEELEFCIGQVCIDTAFIPKVITSVSAIYSNIKNCEVWRIPLDNSEPPRWISADCIQSIPYMDQIKTKRLFKLVLAK